MCVKWKKSLLAMVLMLFVFFSSGMQCLAEVEISAPSAILVEASTGEVIYEKNSAEVRSPASITKIMTLLLTFEKMEEGKASLEDEVLVSAHAAGMGGSQVYLAEGETQTLETMLKCIVVSSGNDASVAVAEHLAGSEEVFVEWMNEKAESLGMTNTHFVDCCGLTDSDDHYSTARDVAVMSRELINRYPDIYQYTQIWMDTITHNTRQGSSIFGLSSTNKLLKQYPYTTGLKTGSTSKALFCVSATAHKDNIDLIAVVMGAPTGKERFQDAKVLLNYGFGRCSLYIDESEPALPELAVRGGVEKQVKLSFEGPFRYLDVDGNALTDVEKKLVLPEELQAPVGEGEQVGYISYCRLEKEIGRRYIITQAAVEKAAYSDCVRQAWYLFCL